ncbi:MAG: hypothetical protein K2X99_06580 [Gemmatimonadaceae bacterium]|nr:hypothetical protein [Gemmatimonadaceae bacterium]
MLARIIPALALLLIACRGESPVPATRTAAQEDSLARARQDSINRARPDYIVDSILPVEEELRRFRAAIGGTPTTALTGGATSREELLARVSAAVERRDTLALQALALSAREFADLVYLSSPNARPPYRQAPGFVWSQIELRSRTGLRRLVERRGGLPLAPLALRCGARAEAQGENRLYTDCVITRLGPRGDTLRELLFGSIIERGGRFKVVSYANQF